MPIPRVTILPEAIRGVKIARRGTPASLNMRASRSASLTSGAIGQVSPRPPKRLNSGRTVRRGTSVRRAISRAARPASNFIPNISRARRTGILAAGFRPLLQIMKGACSAGGGPKRAPDPQKRWASINRNGWASLARNPHSSPLYNLDTWLWETPLNLIACKSSSTRRVETPLIHAT